MPRKKVTPIADVPGPIDGPPPVAAAPPRKKPGPKPKVKVQTPAPKPPNPAILALQQDIIELVKQRGAVLGAISDANSRLSSAQIQLQGAQQHLNNLEREVQYRMNLIAQMSGKPIVDSGLTQQPVQLAPVYEIPSGYGSPAIPPGVGSIPTPSAPQLVTGIGERRVRSESAEGFRAAEVGVRAAI